jgi:hypothetical protein
MRLNRSTVLVTLVLLAWTAAAHAGDVVLYFSFDALSAGKVPDLSGNGRDATVQGDVTLVDGGKFGKAAKFANKGFLDLGGATFPAALIPTEGMTLAAWVNVDSLADHHAIFNARASDQTWVVHPELRTEANFRWLLRTDGGVTLFDIRAGTAKAQEWTHFAGTYSNAAGVARLLINGKEVGKKDAKGTIAKNWGMGARVGKNIDDARPFTGLMDELVLYNRALTDAEVTDIMTNGVMKPTAVSPANRLAVTWAGMKLAR